MSTIAAGFRRHCLRVKALASRSWDAGSHRLFPAREKQRGLEEAFVALCANVEKLHARIFELEERCRASFPARSSAATLNLTSRNLALKLSRSGRDSREIASILGVPQGEVTLLLKVHRLQASMVPAKKAREEASTKVPNLSTKKEKRRAAISAPAVPAIQ